MRCVVCGIELFDDEEDICKTCKEVLMMKHSVKELELRIKTHKKAVKFKNQGGKKHEGN